MNPFTSYRIFPEGVSDRRFSDTAGLEIYQYSLSSFCRSQAWAATPVCRLKADAFATWEKCSSSSQAGMVCSVNTFLEFYQINRQLRNLAKISFKKLCYTNERVPHLFGRQYDGK